MEHKDMKIHHENIKSSYSIRKVIRQYRSWDHWHQQCEFFYVLEGDPQVRIGGEVYAGNPGDLFVIHSGEIHSISSQQPCTVMISTYDPGILYSIQTELQFIKSHISAEELRSAGLSEQIGRIFGEMLEERENERTMHKVIILADILRLYSLLVRNFERERASVSRSMTKFQHFQIVLSYITEHYNEKISLGSIAQTINYHPSYVSTLFVTYTGVNFKAYIDNFRIGKAVELLRTTELTVSDIAIQCGFDNIRTFNNAFKRVTGTTPSLVRSEST